MKWLLYLLFVLIYFSILILLLSEKYNIKIIDLILVFPIIGNHGPATLAKAYRNAINILCKDKLISKYFHLTIKSYISFEYCKKNLINSNNIIWFQYPNYFKELISNNYSSIFKNIIYGPNVSPKSWFKFPIKNTFEENWNDYISRIFAYVVQSDRIKKHLINRSKKIRNIKNQYIISQGCIMANNNYPIRHWNERNIDILLYVKFADIKKEKEFQYLIKSLDRKYNIKIIRYGNHSKQSILYYASNSKILIYYSFYDCWPSSLMEMLNVGVYPIVQQCEFIEEYGTCIENFNVNEKRIITIVEKLLSQVYNTFDISKSYIMRNNCLRVIKNTLFEIYIRKTNTYNDFFHN